MQKYAEAMRLELLMIGKTNDDAVSELEKKYFKRMQHYWPFDSKVIADIKNTKNLSKEQIKEQEGQKILSEKKAGDLLILLDEKGKEFHSRGFAQQLQTWFNRSPKRIVFCIGGAYGFSPDVYAAADGKISLSKMTFSHQIIRAIFAEQIYRAATILKGEPYHHD
jgi:23S rRNA (pseudouridine1915-N3)-methyltransferase